MAQFDKLEFVITASTAALRGELARGTDAVKQFADNSERTFSRHQTSLEGVSRSIRRVINLYGLVAATRWAGRQIEDATKLNKLTQEQADKLSSARDEVGRLGDAWDEMWRRAALGGSGFFETLTRGVRRTIEDVSGGPSDRAGQIASIQQQIAEHNAALQSGKASFFGVDVELSAKGIAKYREELDALWETYKKLQGTDPAKTLGQLDWEKKLAALQDITVSGTRTTAGQLFQGPGTDALERAVKVAEELKTPLEKDLEKLKDIRDLLSRGLLRPDAVQRYADDKLVGFDLEAIHAKMKQLPKVTDEAAESAKRFSEAFSASFESRGIQALLDGDLSGALKGIIRDLAEMVLRLVILQPIAEKFAATMKGSAGGGSSGGSGWSTLFSSLFGSISGKAAGGPVNAGQPYIVGEKGPELWVPNSSGHIYPNGMGGAVNVTQHIHYDVSLESVDNRIAQSAGAISNLAVMAVRNAMTRPKMA